MRAIPRRPVRKTLPEIFLPLPNGRQKKKNSMQPEKKLKNCLPNVLKQAAKSLFSKDG